MIAERKEALQKRIGEFTKQNGDVKKKLFISAGLSAGIFVANWVGIPAFALEETELVGKWLPGSWDKGWVLGLSYGAQIASSAVSLIQERRLLKNLRIGMNQNLAETAAYYGLEKIKPLKEKGRRSLVAVLTPTIASLAWIIPREMTFVSLALLSPEKMRELVILKSGQGLFSLSQAGAAEIALRTMGKEKKVEETKEEKIAKLPVWKTIFRRPRIQPISAQEERI